MSKSKTYTPGLGEDITTCITNALEMSKDLWSNITTDVKFTFNGIEMIVNAKQLTGYYLSIWHTKCKERSAAYKASPEAKEAEIKIASRKITLQAEMDTHLAILSDSYRGYHNAFAYWLKLFVELSDNMGVTYSKESVLSKFEMLGYTENEYVGWKGEWTTEISVKYITGQVINCINKMGLIPPVAISMCEKVLAEGGV